MKYVYSFYENEDGWTGDTYTSITDALANAEEESDGNYDVVYVGEEYLCEPKLDTDDVVDILEKLLDQVYDECGEAAEVWEPYDYSEKEELEELTSILNMEITEWMERHRHGPNCYAVRNINEYLL